MSQAPLSELDHQRLRKALVLAEEGIGVTDPNPRVGCILGLADGTVLGRGHTQQAGGPHAEVMALREAQIQGRLPRGATAWVTLEPCAHQGRTPPCCDALIAAGVARVVIAVGDPYPQVNGAGMARMRAAGIEIVLAEGEYADAARELNIGYFSRIQRQRPWVRMKIAASLDGRTALVNGASQWITGLPARTDGHAWRKRASAVLTGVGTVREDDPRLDVRLVPTHLQPLRVVVDSRLQTPPGARLLSPPGQVLVVHASVNATPGAALLERGAELLCLPAADGKVDLVALITELARRGVNELHVEAGHKLNASLLGAGLVDELLVYLAPKLLGIGREIAAFGPIENLADGLEFRFFSVELMGNDLRLRARRLPQGDPADASTPQADRA